jgi:hypothetical protein
MAAPIPDRRRERSGLDKRFPHSNLINVEGKNAPLQKGSKKTASPFDFLRVASSRNVGADFSARASGAGRTCHRHFEWPSSTACEIEA